MLNEQKNAPASLYKSLRPFLKKFRRRLRKRVRCLSKYKKLKKNNFVVKFIHEGNTEIVLPSLSIMDILFGKSSAVTRDFDYFTRPHAEVLLRKTIYEMYRTGYLSPKKSIVDIGSWISDNSIVWAKQLIEDAVVFAIDPSSNNLSFGKMVAEHNGIDNIRWVEAVCSERAGEKFDFDGSIDHATFKKSASKNYLISTTIDEIVTKESSPALGLLHVDVEGFELSVLKGAEKLILSDQPVISFEQHISKEDVGAVSKYLKSFDYRVFMLNEVLPGCDLDCRNFLAFPRHKGIPSLENFEQSKGRDLSIFSAAIGPVLLEI